MVASRSPTARATSMTTSSTPERAFRLASITHHKPKSAVLRIRLTRADKIQIRRDARKLRCAMSALVLALYMEGRASIKELAG